MKKQLLSALCVIALVLCICVPLAACTDKAEQNTVMNVSLNPEVEFILDGNNKVISVNALNEDGNLVINGQAFVGKDADKAIELYIEVCKETGFIVTGNVKDGENEIKIAFSGEDAQKHYDEISKKVEKYLSQENINATLQKAADLTTEYINNLVAECAPQIDAAKLAALSEMEKIEQLAESRKETANMYSQALKDAYYQAKEAALNQARLDAVKAQLSDVQRLALSVAEASYTSACETLELTRNTVLVNADSPYQLALVAFREAKTAYLNYRNYVAQNTDADTAKLDQLANALDKAETALENAYTTANNQLDTLHSTMTSAYNSVCSAITAFGVNVNELIDQSAASIDTALTNFETSFATAHNQAITSAQNSWNAMKEQLKKGYQPEEQ